MSNDGNDTKHPKRWWRIVKRALKVLMVLAGLAATGYLVGGYLIERELDQRVQRLREANEPVNFGQRRATCPPGPRAQDAGPLYEAAMALADREGLYEAMDWAKAIEEGTAATPEQTKAAEELLEQNRLCYEMLDLGAAKPECSFDLRDEISVAVGQMTLCRTLARINSVRTHWRVLHGQSDAAAESAVASFKLAGIFHHPVLISHLVRCAVLSLAAADVPGVLKDAKISEPLLVRLQQAIQSAETQIDMARVWKMERVFLLNFSAELLTRTPQEAMETWRPSVELSPRIDAPLARLQIIREFDQYERLILAAAGDWPEVIHASQEAARPRPSLLDSLIPQEEVNLGQVMPITGRTVAQLRSARVAVMAEIFRLKNGRLPASLEELAAAGQAIPADPFTGKPLTYRTAGEGFTIFATENEHAENAKLNSNGFWGVSVRYPKATTEPAAK